MMAIRIVSGNPPPPEDGTALKADDPARPPTTPAAAVFNISRLLIDFIEWIFASIIQAMARFVLRQTGNSIGKSPRSRPSRLPFQNGDAFEDFEQPRRFKNSGELEERVPAARHAWILFFRKLNHEWYTKVKF